MQKRLKTLVPQARKLGVPSFSGKNASCPARRQICHFISLFIFLQGMKKGILLVSTLLCFTLSCSKEGLLPKEGSSLSKGPSYVVSSTVFDIHCFVIDGYKLTRTKYTHYHYYVYDSRPPGVPLPEPPDYTTYTYSSPTLSNIKINWGWASQWGSDPINDGWYTLTGSWTVTNGGTYDYNHYRYMIYGFSVS